MNRLEELLLLWQDQTISADEVSELKSLLAHPDARATVAQDFFLTGVLLESLRAQKVAGEFGKKSERPASLAVSPVRPSRRVLVVWMAGAAVVLFVVGAFFLLRTPSPTDVFAQFEQVQGNTFVVTQEQKRPAQAGQFLVRGDGIATQGANSEAVVQMEDAVRLTLGGDTTVFTATEVDQPNASGAKVVLEQGELLVEVTRSLKRQKMTVETPLGVAVTEADDTALHVSDSAGVAVVRGAVHFVHKATGKSIRLQGGEYVAFTPEGDIYAAQLFSGNGQVWTTFPSFGIETNSLSYAVGFDPDGQTLAAVARSGESGLRFGPVEGRPVPREVAGHQCLGFSPDGKVVATADLLAVTLYETATGKPKTILKSNDARTRPTCLAFAPNGKTLAVVRPGWRDMGPAVEVWDVETGILRLTFRAHTAAITAIAFSPDSNLLASGSLDKTIVLWDVPTGEERTRVLMVPARIVWSLAFAPDGKTLAIATGNSDFRVRVLGEVKLWDVATETVRGTLSGHNRAVTSVIYADDGQTLITGSADTTVRFWDPATGRQYGMLKGHKAAPGFEAIVVALSPDGNWLATASLDRTVKVWKTTWKNQVARPNPN